MKELLAAKGGALRVLFSFDPRRQAILLLGGDKSGEWNGWYALGDNKFPISADGLKGKWTNDFSGALQYVNAVTGFDAGMNTHASNENFQFGPGSSFKWDLSVASGMVGNIKFQSVKSSGKFTVDNDWRVTLSDIEGRPRSFDARFSRIKGLRVQWLDVQPYAKAD